MISFATAVLAAFPTILWLIIRAVTHAAGAFYVICTVLFAGVLVLLFLALLAVEVACAVKCLKKEPVEVPFVTAWVAKLANKM